MRCLVKTQAGKEALKFFDGFWDLPLAENDTEARAIGEADGDGNIIIVLVQFRAQELQSACDVSGTTFECPYGCSNGDAREAVEAYEPRRRRHFHGRNPISCASANYITRGARFGLPPIFKELLSMNIS